MILKVHVNPLELNLLTQKSQAKLSNWISTQGYSKRRDQVLKVNQSRYLFCEKFIQLFRWHFPDSRDYSCGNLTLKPVTRFSKKIKKFEIAIAFLEHFPKKS